MEITLNRILYRFDAMTLFALGHGSFSGTVFKGLGSFYVKEVQPATCGSLHDMA